LNQKHTKNLGLLFLLKAHNKPPNALFHIRNKNMSKRKRDADTSSSLDVFYEAFASARLPNSLSNLILEYMYMIFYLHTKTSGKLHSVPLLDVALGPLLLSERIKTERSVWETTDDSSAQTVMLNSEKFITYLDCGRGCIMQLNANNVCLMDNDAECLAPLAVYNMNGAITRFCTPKRNPVLPHYYKDHHYYTTFTGKNLLFFYYFQHGWRVKEWRLLDAPRGTRSWDYDQWPKFCWDHRSGICGILCANEEHIVCKTSLHAFVTVFSKRSQKPALVEICDNAECMKTYNASACFHPEDPSILLLISIGNWKRLDAISYHTVNLHTGTRMSHNCRCIGKGETNFGARAYQTPDTTYAGWNPVIEWKLTQNEEDEQHYLTLRAKKET